MESWRDDAKRLWNETFHDDPHWVEAYFSRVYDDSHLLGVADASGRSLASMMLLQPYTMLFHGSEMPVGYISGVATRPRHRGKGLMSSLMAAALRKAAADGMGLVTLIPASQRLAVLYRRYGFRPTFPCFVDCFTSASLFEDSASPAGELEPVADLLAPGVYEAFHALELELPGRVTHTKAQWLSVLDDVLLDGGMAAGVCVAGGGDIQALGFAVEGADGVVAVKDLLCRSQEAAFSVLGQMRQRWPDKPMRVWRPVAMAMEGDHRRSPEPRGMARVADAQRLLATVAVAHPALDLTVRVTDSLVAANNATWHLHHGRCTEAEGPLPKAPDLDVDASVLTVLALASTRVGEVMGLPSQQPSLALMLE